MRIVIITANDGFFLSHRKDLGLFLIKEGWGVYVLAQKTKDEYVEEIISLGFEFIPICFDRSKMTQSDVKMLVELYSIYKKITPDLIIAVALKPILWGGVVARQLSIPMVGIVSGLGFLFTGERKMILKKMVVFGLRYLISKRNNYFIFQNDDDKEIFIKNNIVAMNKFYMIRGMGVNLGEFKQTSFHDKQRVRFLFPARMLKDKGLIEYIDAAKIVEKQVSHVEFILAGSIDRAHPTAVAEEELKELIANTSISWIGYQENMIPVYEASDIVVLPSYREGFPKVLIEAAAIGRPIITTDVPGCKDAVQDGINGYLVPVKNVEKLVEKMFCFIYNNKLKYEMGNASSRIARKYYDNIKINTQYLSFFNTILSAETYNN